MKHTPGPWEYDIALADNGDKETRMYGSEKSELLEPVCIIPHDDITEQGYMEVQANAALIAAAPQLLDACKRVLKMLGNSSAHEKEILHLAVKAAKRVRVE